MLKKCVLIFVDGKNNVCIIRWLLVGMEQRRVQKRGAPGGGESGKGEVLDGLLPLPAKRHRYRERRRLPEF